jgi:putative transposase
MRSSNTVSFIGKYPVVWYPKYRRSVLVKGADVRLEQVIRDVAKERNAEVIEREVMPDHGHLWVDVDPQFGIHRLVKLIKGRSSRRLRQEFPWICSKFPPLWSNSDFVATVGGAPLAVVKRYIESPKRT